ncbi:MAG: SPOR domain-containing protein [Bacteroidota bacterium]
MEKQLLKEKILKAVGLNEEHIEQVFKIFLSRLSEVLNVSQTIRMEDIGYFQLRAEPVSRLERDQSNKSKNILLYKAIQSDDQRDEKNLYLTLEIESDEIEPSGFNESVFSLSVDKPSTIFDSDDDSTAGRTGEALKESIKDNINEIIAAGVILEGYELLDKGAAETHNIDESHELTSEILENDIIKQKEELLSQTDESTESVEDESQTTNEEIPQSNWEKEPDHIEDEKIIDPELEKELDSKAESQYQNPFDELNDLINKEKESVEDEKVNNQTIYNETKSSFHSDDRGSKRLIYLAFAAIFVILLIAIIYFTSGTSEPPTRVQSYVEKDNNVTTDQTEKPIGQIDTNAVDSSAAIETSKEDTLLKGEETKTIQQKEQQPVKKEVVSEVKKTEYTGLYRDIERDISITDRIYYDGVKYSVQISSWKSKTIAEHEVNKLKKKGFDAFIYQIYLKSKDGTWNRVRIGYFNSKQEAAQFLKQNKL